MLSTIIPILLLLLLGVSCRKTSLIGDAGIDALKTISIRFLWPLVLFYAFFTASYDARTVVYAGTVFILLTAAFFLTGKISGFAGSRSRLLPYLSVGSEIGMLGYSLYILLFGAENVYRLALFDVGHALFIFPVYLTCLNVWQGEGSLKDSLIGIVKSPLIIMLVIGLICGLSGFGDFVMESPAGEVLNRVYELASSSNIVMMLTAMGYGIAFSRKQVLASVRFIGYRAILMAVCTVIGLLVIKGLVGLDLQTACALILVFMLPPVYMLSVYVKDRDDNEFASTTTSIYTLLTIAAFIVMTVIVK